MKTPHPPHADMICAWAQDTSRKAQVDTGNGVWCACLGDPSWHPAYKYRFAPEPIVTYFRVFGTQICHSSETDKEANLRLTFDRDTDKLLTAEVLK